MRKKVERSIAKNIVLAVIASGLFAFTSVVPAAATFTLDEPFSDPTAVATNWTLTDSAAVVSTAGQTPENVLRLTSTALNQRGFAQYNTPIDFSAGLDFTFNMAMWGGSGNDGLSFYVRDARSAGTTGTWYGYLGAALGYAPWGGDNQGMDGGLLNLAFSTGGYGYSEADGSVACPTDAERYEELPSQNLIALRGGPGYGGGRSDNYCLLATKEVTTNKFNNGYSTRSDATKAVRIVVDPATTETPMISVYYAESFPLTSSDLIFQAPLPDYMADVEDVVFGFSGATGGGTNNHEIWNLGVTEAQMLSCPIMFPYIANNASSTLLSGHQISVTGSTLKNGFSFSGVGSYWADTLTSSLDATFEISPPSTKFGFEAFYNADAILLTHEIVSWTAKNSAGEVVDTTYSIDNRDTTAIESFTFSEPVATLEFTYLPTTGGFGSIFKTYVYADAAYCASATTTVMYDAGDGSVSPTSAEWSEGDDPLTLPTPTRDGYHFAGWFDADTGGTLIGKAGDEYTPESDVTLYAQWQILCDSVEQEVGRHTLVTFNFTGECHWEVPGGITEIEYLVVAGGGGGGGGSVRGASCAVYDGGGVATRRGGGGGGGAGGTMLEGSLTVEPGDAYVVRIGSGGAGGSGGTCPAGSVGQAGANGSSGEQSRFGSVVSDGGEGGIGGRATGAGGNGGSNDNYSGGNQPNSAMDCPKNATVGCFAGAGGAGAGAAGESISETAPTSEFGGDGGAGAVSEITGITYAGGGGGGNRSRYSEPGNLVRRGGSGGTGGGGAGNDDGSGFGGTDGLGGGGGGGRGNGNNQANLTNAGAGGTGGDGTVVVRYVTPFSGYWITFNSNGGDPVPATIAWPMGSDPISLPDTTLTRYQFRGWFTADGTRVGAAGTLFTPTGDTVLFAKWIRNSTGSSNNTAPVVEILENKNGKAKLDITDPLGRSVSTSVTSVSKEVSVAYKDGILEILDKNFVGNVVVTLTVTNSVGVSTSEKITLTVNPPAPNSIEALFVSTWNNLRLDTMIATKTKIVWNSTTSANSYQVLLDGKVIGITSKPEFTISTILNPKKRLKVIAIGPDNTKSVPQNVRLADELMHIARVNFAAASAELSPSGKQVLDKLAKQIVKQKLRVIDLRGYTDNQGGEDGAIELSKARALTVRAYLRAALVGQRVWIKQSWFGNTNPAMPNDTVYSLALNRRVEIYVGK